MHSLSEHRKCCKRRCRMKEMWSEKIHHGFGRKKYGYSCGSLALQSPGGSSVAMFKNTPTHDFSIVLQIPNMDWKYVQSMHSLSVHPKSYTGRSLMIESDRDEINGRTQYGYRSWLPTSWLCNPPGGSSVAMFKSTPSHRWLPNSTTDPQPGFNLCSNDAFPFCTSKILHTAVSNDRAWQRWDQWSDTVWIYIVVASYFLALQSPGGSSVAMFKSIPSHRWLPNSSTDSQPGFNICSNDAFPFCTSKILHRALSNDRDEINGRTQYGYISLWLLTSWLCNPLWAAQ